MHELIIFLGPGGGFILRKDRPSASFSLLSTILQKLNSRQLESRGWEVISFPLNLWTEVLLCAPCAWQTVVLSPDHSHSSPLTGWQFHTRRGKTSQEDQGLIPLSRSIL